MTLITTQIALVAARVSTLQSSWRDEVALLENGQARALAVRSAGTRCVDSTLERHLVYGPSAFRVHPGANLVQKCETLRLSSKVLQ